MSLKADDYDPSEAIELLVQRARGCVGKPVWRMAGPEIEAFVRYEVAGALLRAFRDAESLYIDDMIKTSHQHTVTILESVLAGVEIAERKAEE